MSEEKQQGLGEWARGAADKVMDVANKAPHAINNLTQKVTGFHTPLAALYTDDDLKLMLKTPHVMEKKIKVKSTDRDREYLVVDAGFRVDGKLYHVYFSGGKIMCMHREGTTLHEQELIESFVSQNVISAAKEVIGKKYFEQVGHAYYPGGSVKEGEKDVPRIQEDKPFVANKGRFFFDGQGYLYKGIEEGDKVTKWEQVDLAVAANVPDFDAAVTIDEKVAKETLPKFVGVGSLAREVVRKTGILQGETVVGGLMFVVGAMIGGGQFMRDADSTQARDNSLGAKLKRGIGGALMLGGIALGVGQFMYGVGVKKWLTKEGEMQPDGLGDWIRDRLLEAKDRQVPLMPTHQVSI